MAFKVPESVASKPENRFEFEHEGKTYSVPKLGFVCGEASLLFEQGREFEGSLAAFDVGDAREAYLSLSVDQRRAFDAAWVEASRVSPGESEGSTDS